MIILDCIEQNVNENDVIELDGIRYLIVKEKESTENPKRYALIDFKTGVSREVGWLNFEQVQNIITKSEKRKYIGTLSSLMYQWMQG